MTSFEPGGIALVQFPFTDLSSSKRRPAVILSSRDYPLRHGDVVLMPLTSQPQPKFALTHWRNAGLPKSTWLKPVVGTISSRLIVKVIGSVDSADDAVIQAAIREALDRRWLA